MSKEVETMKKFLLAVAVLCIGTMAFAGPNAGGTLIITDGGIMTAATNGAISVCGQGVNLTACTAAVVRSDATSGAASAEILKVYAAFSSTASPRLMGIAWGLHITGDASVEKGWNCADFELPDAGWPGDLIGNSCTWNLLQTAHLIPVYAFSGYNAGAGGTVELVPNPSQGAVFGDDTVPAILDPIEGLGSFGLGMDGHLVCPFEPPQPGACCDPATGNCTFILQADCTMNWRAGVCDPNPCPPPPMGACCDPATGACVDVIASACQGVWHLGIACSTNPCPQLGACCLTDNSCVMVLQTACTGIWKGVTCTPELCLPVPVQHNSWGQIKNLYR
jgi:hypothetical protein